MRIDCYYYDSCGSREVLPSRLEQALAQTQARAGVEHHVISLEEGQRLGILGSPTVLIDGNDILGAGQGGGT